MLSQGTSLQTSRPQLCGALERPVSVFLSCLSHVSFSRPRMKGSEDASPHSPSLSDYGEDHSCDTAVTENDVSPSCLNPLLAKDERDQIPQRSPQGAAKDQQEEETSQGDVFDYSCLPPELVAHLTSFIEDGTTFLSIAFTVRYTENFYRSCRVTACGYVLPVRRVRGCPPSFRKCKHIYVYSYVCPSMHTCTCIYFHVVVGAR